MTGVVSALSAITDITESNDPFVFLCVFSMFVPLKSDCLKCSQCVNTSESSATCSQCCAVVSKQLRAGLCLD